MKYICKIFANENYLKTWCLRKLLLLPNQNQLNPLHDSSEKNAKILLEIFVEL